MPFPKMTYSLSEGIIADSDAAFEIAIHDIARASLCISESAYWIHAISVLTYRINAIRSIEPQRVYVDEEEVIFYPNK